jgi:uncharacterized DUF497 family protein
MAEKLAMAQTDHPLFQWDEAKNRLNLQKHGVNFAEARQAFIDPGRVILDDSDHSGAEKRFFCLGMVDGMVMTVRFTWRDGQIRIFGAGYWRKGRKLYEQIRSIHG